EGSVVTVRDLPLEMQPAEGIGAIPSEEPKRRNGGPSAIDEARFQGEQASRERELLVRALAAAGGNKAEAARALGMSRSTLFSRLKRLGLG
ncbi:MAG TPA: helix-turn-helix domain-containing protein, partial [Gemmataceae bacterium]|nr:helix-turn-helix domain-containing protein [Gemmataceae bacterium]